MSGRAGRDHGPPSPGDCPECEAPIPSTDVLVEYETDDRRRRMFAECPSCGEVVHPTGSAGPVSDTGGETPFAVDR